MLKDVACVNVGLPVLPALTRPRRWEAGPLGGPSVRSFVAYKGAGGAHVSAVTSVRTNGTEGELTDR
jgi:hypothetical protein